MGCWPWCSSVEPGKAEKLHLGVRVTVGDPFLQLVPPTAHLEAARTTLEECGGLCTQLPIPRLFLGRPCLEKLLRFMDPPRGHRPPLPAPAIKAPSWDPFLI